jgi:hypothetical protein
MIDAGTLMMFIIITGFALCGVYFRGQYRDWRRQRTADDKDKARIHLLCPGAEASHQQESVGERAVDVAAGRFIGSSVRHSRALSLTDIPLTEFNKPLFRYPRRYPRIKRVPGGTSNDMIPNLQNPGNPLPYDPMKLPSTFGSGD